MESPLDTEAVLSSLKELAAERHQKIPQILEDYLLHVARTGNVVFENEWTDVKRLLKLKLDCNIDYFQHFCSDLPTDKDFSLHQSRTFLYDRFDFFSRPPFTIQRLVEVLTTSRRQYRRIDKYLRAVEKNLMVVSTFGQEAEFTCETKYVPHFNYASPTVSKVGQADLIPLQNAAMDFEVRTRLSMRIFNPALNTAMNGDESDDEEEDEEMDEDSDVPYVHPAIEGSAGEPMEGGEIGGDSPARKGLLRKRKLRPQAEEGSASPATSSESEPVAMETSTPEETVNGIGVKETDPTTANTEESPKASTAPVEETNPVPEVTAEEQSEPESKVENGTLLKAPQEEVKNVEKEPESKKVKVEKEDVLKPVEETEAVEEKNESVPPAVEKKVEVEEDKIIVDAVKEEVSEKPELEKSEGGEKETKKASVDCETPSS